MRRESLVKRTVDATIHFLPDLARGWHNDGGQLGATRFEKATETFVSFALGSGIAAIIGAGVGGLINYFTSSTSPYVVEGTIALSVGAMNYLEASAGKKIRREKRFNSNY